jgi:hypothetical protein
MTTAVFASTTAENGYWTFNMARRERTGDAIIDAFDQFNSDWEVVTPEDIFVKRSLKRKLRTAVLKAAESMSTWESDDNDEDKQEDDSTPDAMEIAAGTSLSLPRSRAAASAADDTDDTIEIINSLCPRPVQDAAEWLETRPNCVLNFLFPRASFHLIQERNWLPEGYGSLRLIYELDLNHLIVHLASPAHDAAANSFNFMVVYWSSNCNIMNTTLLQLGEAHWTYTPGSEKSPDQSWYPWRSLARPLS